MYLLVKPIQFEIVELQVRKLYGDYSLTDPKAINELCDFVEEFIVACGWSIPDYIDKIMGFNRNQSS